MVSTCLSVAKVIGYAYFLIGVHQTGSALRVLKSAGEQRGLGFLVEEVQVVDVERNLHLLAGTAGGAGIDAGDDVLFLAAGGQVEVGLGAHELGHFDVAVDHRIGSGLDEHILVVDVLGTDAHVDFLADVVLIRELGQLAGRDDDLVVAEDGGHVVAFLDQLDGEEVHLRAADEAGNEQVGGIVVQVLRGIDLLHKAVLHNHDTGSHGHGLGLVVGHVDEGGLQALMQLGDLGTHGNAQLGVQVVPQPANTLKR